MKDVTERWKQKGGVKRKERLTKGGGHGRREGHNFLPYLSPSFSHASLFFHPSLHSEFKPVCKDTRLPFKLHYNGENTQPFSLQKLPHINQLKKSTGLLVNCGSLVKQMLCDETRGSIFRTGVQYLLLVLFLQFSMSFFLSTRWL